MESSAGLVADHGRQLALDPGVDVLVRGVEDRRGKTGIAIGEEPPEEGLRRRGVDDPLAGEHRDVCQVHEQVGPGDPPVRAGRR